MQRLTPLKIKAFTLIEVMIAIGLVAFIAAVTLVAVDPVRRFAEVRNARRWQDVNSILNAVKLYAVDNKVYPTGLDQDLKMIGTAGSGCSAPCGIHLSLAPGGSALAAGTEDRVAAAFGVEPALAQAAPAPTVVSFKVDPQTASPGQIITATAEVSSGAGIVSAAVDWGGLATTPLTLASGDVHDGIWRGHWTVSGAESKQYAATLTATDAAGGTATASAAWNDPTGWVLPTGFSAPTGQWTNVPLAYDNDITTYASNNYGGTGWGEYVYFTLASPIYSDRLRVNADYTDIDIQQVEIDVMLNGSWTTVFNGGSEAVWNDKWVEVPYAGGSVSQARFRYNYKRGGYYYWLYEFQFYQSSPTVIPPIVSTQSAQWVQDTAATLEGLLTDDGGTSCQYRFEYGLTPAYGSATSWTGGLASGDTFSDFIYGLSPNTTYHYRAEAQNSAGMSYGGDMTFNTRPPATGWISPSSFSDPDGAWTDQDLAMDQNLITYASSYHNIGQAQWSSFIYYSLASPIVSNDIRFYARGPAQVSQVDVDVHENGAWTDVYQGSFAGLQWVEETFAAGSIDQTRIRFYAANANEGFFWQLYDIQFQKSSETTGDACLDLNAILSPTFIAQVPADPLNGAAAMTLYSIRLTGDGEVTVYACDPELGQTISVAR